MLAITERPFYVLCDHVQNEIMEWADGYRAELLPCPQKFAWHPDPTIGGSDIYCLPSARRQEDPFVVDQ